MKTPGKIFLLLSGTLWLLVGVIVTVLAVVQVIVNPAEMLSVLGEVLPRGIMRVLTGIVNTVPNVVLLVVGAAAIIIGIVGIASCGKTTKGGSCIVLGTLMIVGLLAGFGLLYSAGSLTLDAVTGILGTVLLATAVCYIVGGLLNKNATVKTA